MDLARKLQQVEEVIKKGAEFYEMLKALHDITEGEATQLEELTRTDERFRDAEKRLRELGRNLSD